VIAALLNDKTLRVAAYWLAAALALGAALVARRGPRRAGFIVPAFWFAAALIVGVLALSRQVDLASQLAATGRQVFRTEGWYPDRRPVQEATVLAVLGIAGLVGVAGMVLMLVRRHAQIIPGFVTLLGLGTFLAVRAISLHDIDALLYRRALGHVQINALAELGAVVAVASAAALAISLGSSRGGRAPE
jgi:hypothetical protein